MFREVTTRRVEKVSAWRKHCEKVERLAEGVKVRLKDFHVPKKFENWLEITSNASAEIEAEQQAWKHLFREAMHNITSPLKVVS